MFVSYTAQMSHCKSMKVHLFTTSGAHFLSLREMYLHKIRELWVTIYHEPVHLNQRKAPL